MARGSFALGRAILVGTDYSSGEVRRLAQRAKNAGQARRLLAIAAVLDGSTREEAARIGGMDRQTLRDWVIRFNEQGPEGLICKYVLDRTVGSSSWWVSDEARCPPSRGRQHLFPRDRQSVKESLHRGLSEAPSSLMRARLIVLRDPAIEVRLQLGN